MEHKSFRVAELKAVDGELPGTFEAIISVFGNVDEGGDIVEKGAFTDTLKKGLPPIVWTHDWLTPPIGATLDAKELDTGLWLKGRFFVGEGEDSPVARAVYTAMKAKDGRGQAPLREFSFGYQATKASYTEQDGERIRHLEAIDMFEAGPTFKGMNDQTQLLAIKGAEKAGRMLSKETELKIREMRLMADQIQVDCKTLRDLIAGDLTAEAKSKANGLLNDTERRATVMAATMSTLIAANGGAPSAPKSGRPDNTTSTEEPQPEDTPEPTSETLVPDNEAEARIRQLLASQPVHV